MGIARRRHPPVKSFLFLLAYWAALVPLFAVWLGRDQAPYPWDMSLHARAALEAWQALTHARPGDLYRLSSYYPPLFHWLAAPFSLISTHPDAYCAANLLVLLAAMVGVWLAGRALTGQGAAALGAACLLPGFALVSRLTLQPMLDLTLMVTVAWTLWLLVRGVSLCERKQAHALGLAIALGLLAKWPYLFFTALPLLGWLAGEARRARAEGRLRVFWSGLGWLAFWPLLLAGPWYVRAVPVILSKAGAQLGGQVASIEGDPAVLSLGSLFFYPRVLLRDYLRWPLAGLLLAGAGALGLWRWKTGGYALGNRRGWGLLALHLASGLALLTLIANKDPRYAMPLVPALALLAAHWIGWLRGKAQKTAVASLVLLGAGLTAYNLFVLAPPNPADMKIEAVAEWLLAHKPAGRAGAQVLVIPNDWSCNSTALGYALYRRDRASAARPARGTLRRKMFQENQFILLCEPSGPNTGVAPRVRENTAQVRANRGWHEVARWRRGDGKTLCLLGRVQPSRVAKP